MHEMIRQSDSRPLETLSSGISPFSPLRTLGTLAYKKKNTYIHTYIHTYTHTQSLYKKQNLHELLLYAVVQFFSCIG